MVWYPHISGNNSTFKSLIAKKTKEDQFILDKAIDFITWNNIITTPCYLNFCR